MWFRYNSFVVAEMKAGQTYTSDEVTAIYDNATRQSLILGSISHDTWKTAIEADAADGHLTDLDIYGGISHRLVYGRIHTTRWRMASFAALMWFHRASLLAPSPTGGTDLKHTARPMRLYIRLSNGPLELPWAGIVGRPMRERSTTTAIWILLRSSAIRSSRRVLAGIR
jgi:hypothetical protein